MIPPMIIAITLTTVITILWTLNSLYNRYKERKFRNVKQRNLSDKFEDLLKWKVGDTISYTRGNSGRIFRHYIILLKPNGVYVGSAETYNLFMREQKKQDPYFEMIGKRVEFVPTERIIENLSLPEREQVSDFKISIEDDMSYHNHITSLQEELQELNSKHTQKA